MSAQFHPTHTRIGVSEPALYKGSAGATR